MGWFRKHIHTDENGEKWEMFDATVLKAGAFEIKGVEHIPPKKIKW